MADEAQLQFTMNIRKVNQVHPYSTSFKKDIDGVGGPTPGQILVTPYGTDVDLSQIDVPGLCWITNLDENNYVEVGIRDPESHRFYPLLEIGPGERYPYLLSRNLREEYGVGPSTGTGTFGSLTNALCIRSYNQNCKVIVEAFEK